jgi:hypothetical protein
LSRAISRESFRELNNYLGVYLQQGRPILDADWNENQDIAVSFMRRLGREALGDGSPNRGFAIDPVLPPPPSLLLEEVDTTGMDFEEAIGAIIGACIADLVTIGLYLVFGPLLFFLDVPGDELDGFESLDGFDLSSPQGRLRIGRDRPYAGGGFLRLSGHPGTVTVTRTLATVKDLSDYELATFRFRQSHQSPGTIRFFLEDENGDRSVWERTNPALAQDVWLASFVTPLDIRFRVVTPSLPPAVVNQDYSGELVTYAGTAPMTWAVSDGSLPAGLTLEAVGTGEETRKGRISGTPTAVGSKTFKVKVTDGGGEETEKELTLEVRATGGETLQLPTAAEILSQIGKSEAPTGTPADLTAIKRYGFELYQDGANPLVWDLDDLRLGSSAMQESAARNNFIIRGSELIRVMNQLTLMTALSTSEEENGDGSGGDDEDLQNLLDLLNTDLDLSEPDVETAGRMYVGGLPCLQVEDLLYSEQADPNDDPLSPPPAGRVRRDTVYLDVWTEPVTYVQDPAIREVALGGPDTATRERVRHRVRVAEGGETPTGNGIGKGTLATEGSYTGRANRLYRVEIDTPGGIGQATFRWSDENAATIQRVIEPVPPGSKRVVVEDAAAFHKGDKILIRKEFGAEEHEIDSVFANVIGLVGPTGAQLDALPAADRVPGFTTFSLGDRPMVQRWNAFRRPITSDPADATISEAIALDDGVQVRFGGRGMRTGDYWNFTTRFLAGDEVSGIDPVTRIERLDFQRARGVTHDYATLAVMTRDGDSEEPNKIFTIEDRRPRVGNATTTIGALRDLTALTGTATAYLGGLRLPAGARDSRLLVWWSGDLFLQDPPPAGATLTIRASFYSDEMTDPEAEPDKGKIQDRDARVTMERRPVTVDLPLQLLFAKSDLSFIFLPVTFVPTSVQLFASLSDTGFTVQLTNMEVTVLELKKSF